MLRKVQTHLRPSSPLFPLLLALGLVIHSTTYKVFSIPTVHFDEAWQGMLALRIASEPGFWPLEAMNSYTGPVLHYLLAGAFRVFGSSLETSRAFFVTLNLLSFALLSCGVLRISRSRGPKTLFSPPPLLNLLAFSVFYALIPVSVFNQRIQIEVTSWFSFCYAILLWGVLWWHSHRRSACLLLCLGALLGIWSHILFFTAIISIFGWLLLEHTVDLTSPQGRWLALGLNLVLALFPLRMGLNLKDPFPFLLALGFVGMAILPSSLAYFKSKNRSVLNLERWWPRLYGALGLFALPPLFIYLVFSFNGTWPYATITGDLHYFWVPVNLLTLICLFSLAPRRQRAFLILFSLQLILTGYSVLKATSPKYWMIPTLTLCVGMSLLWGQVAQAKPRIAYAILGVFVSWNLFTFHTSLIGRYSEYGAKDEVFRIGRFADSPLAHRPTLAVYHWLKDHGCHLNPLSLEDGRLQHNIEYLQKLDRSKGAKTRCPWGDSPLMIAQGYQSVPKGNKVVAESNAWGELKVTAPNLNSN